MADLSAELTALGDAIDKELQQVIDAINGGADAAATVEAARAKIVDMTARLNADDTPPTP